MIVIFQLLSLFTTSYSLQGLVSIGRAIKTQQQINHYLLKHQLSLNIQLVDLKDFEELDETSTLRYATKCTYCNKTFKNSSYLQLHQYNKHFDQNLTETILLLNYFCEFTNCLKPYGSSSIQPLPTNIRIQKCLKFSQEFIKFSVLDISKLNQFCDDIVQDEQEPFNEETPYLDAFLNIIQKTAICAYIVGAIYVVKKVQEYVQYLKRKHRRAQPKTNYKEKYDVM